MTLAEQIRSLYGSRGNWDEGGVDRASELADLLTMAGITDVSQIDLKDGKALFGDKAVGFAGDYNNDGTYGSKASDTLQDGNRIGWSARGDGNVSYRVGTDENGNEYLAPEWGSSSDMGKVRTAIKLAALAAGAYYGFGGFDGGLLGGEAAAAGAEAAGAAGGAEAAGSIARLAADPFVSATVGNTAPLAASGTISASSMIPASMSVPIGAAVSAVPAIAGAGGTLAGAKTLAQLAGSAIGAASSKDQTATAQREPWGPAQDWIKSNIKDGQALQDYYKKNHFNDTQKGAMGQMLGLINNGTAMLPGLLDSLNGMGGFKRGGGSTPSPIQFNTQGLLNPAQIDYRNPFGG